MNRGQPSPSARRSTTPPDGDLRLRVLDALRNLLANTSFDEISVAGVIGAAGVSRASFYFYFPSKQAALAELVRRAVGQGERAAQPWIDGHQDPREALRAGVTAGAQLWRENAGVLTAVVESWASDSGLRTLWLEQMDRLTAAAVTRIRADPVALQHLAGLDVAAVAASLTWLGERLYYLAAIGVPPFNDETVLIDTLTNAWTSTLYGPVSPGV